MPYIKKADRSRWSSKLYLIRDEMQLGKDKVSAGDLNYMITTLCLLYFKEKGNRYQTHCEIEGVLQGVSKEFSRRLTNPYEDEKIKENSDLLDF